MKKNNQYIVIAVIVVAVLAVVFYKGENKFNYELPDFALYENVEDDFQFILASGAEGKKWRANATVRAVTMIDGAQPLGKQDNRRIVVFGDEGTGEHYLVKATQTGEFLPNEYEMATLNVGNTLSLGEFKVSSQKALDKASKKNRNVEADPDDDVSVTLVLIDDNGRLVWNYLLIVQRRGEPVNGPAGTVLFVTLDARSGRILNEQLENL